MPNDPEIHGAAGTPQPYPCGHKRQKFLIEETGKFSPHENTEKRSSKTLLLTQRKALFFGHPMKKFTAYLPWILFIVLIGLASAQAQPDTPTKVGPQRGSLVIVGGGLLDTSILEKFIELAGGKDAPIVVIPTASGEFSAASLEQKLNLFRNLGATQVTPLHTTNPAEANMDFFIEPLKSAKGVWFGGGRQWRLVDSYKNTKVENLLWKVLDRGGVIGGSSAGASIQGSYLARGDTSGNQVMVGDHEVGFGYLRNVAIDQHLLARNRHFDMFTILKHYPYLLGFGIDENTAMLVQGDEFEVIGQSYVVVYDGTFWSKEGTRLKEVPDSSSSFYFLSPGDRYDMATRSVVR